jgi:hypothetical protein
VLIDVTGSGTSVLVTTEVTGGGMDTNFVVTLMVRNCVSTGSVEVITLIDVWVTYGV